MGKGKSMNMGTKLIKLTESDLHRIVRESVARVLKESNELYDEWYDEEDYNGDTGEYGLIRSYDLGPMYTSEMEAEADGYGMDFGDYLKYYLKYYLDEVLPECPWYWSQRSRDRNYTTLAQWDGIVVKELPSGQIVVDEYPIGDAERDADFQNRLEQGEYWMK